MAPWFSTPLGVMRLSRRYVDRVTGGNSSGSSDEIKAARLWLFMGLGLASTGFYACHDFLLASYWTSGLHAIGFSSLLVSAGLLRNLARLRLVSHLVIGVLTVLLGLIPLWDGNIHAPGLWPPVLVTVSAPFLFRSRTVIRYALVCGAMVLLNLALGPSFDHLEPVTQTAEQWVQLRLISLFMFGGLVFIGSASSIRARRSILERTESLLQRAREENVAERSKSVFLATMSYELQIPVTGLSRLAHKVRACAPNQFLGGSFDGMCKSSARLVTILESVSDLARLEAGTVEISESPFLIGALLDALHAEYDAKAKAKGLSLRIADGVGPNYLQGDAKRIYQILSSLVDNAIKFSDSGQVEVEVRRDSIDGSKSDELAIRVSDQGIGMNEIQLERVFGQFEQVHDDASLQRGGCGLGLAVSQRLVRLMGGTLEVESFVGKGSTFTCKLHLCSARVGQFHTELSAALGVNFFDPFEVDRGIAAHEPSQEQNQGDLELRRFVMMVAPLVFVFMLRALIQADSLAAFIHGVSLAVLSGCATHAIARFGAGAWGIFLLTLAFSVGAQSVIDGSVHSEALWCIALPPNIVAYAFGLRSAVISMVGAAALILGIGLGVLPGGGFELAQDSVLFTLAVRSTYILAFVGATVLITRGSRAKLAAMQEQQALLHEVSLAAERANEEKSRFFVRIAEEFGSPLRDILGACNAKSVRNCMSMEHVVLLDRIDRCARAIFCLLDRTLLNAGADSTQEIDPREAFDLRRLVDDVCLLFMDEAEVRRVELLVQAGQGSHWYVGDSTRLLEILTLLMSHSLSITTDASLSLRIGDAEPQGADKTRLLIELRYQADTTDASFKNDLFVAQRESAWTRAVETARALGGALRDFESEAKEQVIQLELELDLVERDEQQAA